MVSVGVSWCDEVCIGNSPFMQQSSSRSPDNTMWSAHTAGDGRVLLLLSNPEAPYPWWCILEPYKLQVGMVAV